MINDLDETIRQLLIKAGGLDINDVEVSFKIPDREWSAGLSRPTINCYLFDIRENRDLRQHGMESVSQQGRVAFRQRPVAYFDLTYLITAWTREVEDEHHLIWHALQTLLRFERIPETYVQGALRNSSGPIYARTAMSEGVLKSPGEFWTALDNQIKPSVSYVATIPIDRDSLPVGQPVFTSKLRVPSDPAVEDRWVWFGGFVRDRKGMPVVGAQVWIEERALETSTDQEGRFRLRVPGPGSYTLSAQQNGLIQRRRIEIPEAQYDLAFDEDAASPAHPAKVDS